MHSDTKLGQGGSYTDVRKKMCWNTVLVSNVLRKNMFHHKNATSYVTKLKFLPKVINCSLPSKGQKCWAI
jgi:hypothetical protein